MDMMISINKIEVQGTVGNARVSTFDDRQSINFTLVTNYVYKGREGAPIVETMWFNVTAWAGRSISKETLEGIEKGNTVHVFGRLRVRDDTAADGTVRQITEIVASQVERVDTSQFMQPSKI